MPVAMTASLVYLLPRQVLQMLTQIAVLSDHSPPHDLHLSTAQWMTYHRGLPAVAN
jgi:hypothetical protein